MKVKIDIATLIDEFGKKAKCFRLKIDDSLNTYEDIKISGFLFIGLDQHK